MAGGIYMRDRLGLLDAIHMSFRIPDYLPGNNTTHCNQFVAEVSRYCGFKGLEGLSTNEIVDLVSKHDQWSEVAMDKAQDLANEGTLIIAGLKGSPHGHVNVICPGKMKTSGRWIKVPSVANVGTKNFIGTGLNWAFSDLPKLWAYRPTL